MSHDKEQVVGYYNILYKLDNKDNKENKYVGEPTDQDNTFHFVRSGVASRCIAVGSAENHLAEPVASQEGFVGNLEAARLNEDQIDRALVQFFDNGEGTPQRYKLKVRINLHDEPIDQSPEFIATLTKDWSNFKKYIPLECKEIVMETARHLRAEIKSKYETTPYMGKFHLNQGRSEDVKRPFTQIEPETLVFVWYNNLTQVWMGKLAIYDWMYDFDLSPSQLKPKQIATGIKGQNLFINPKHDKRERPKTWAQLRAERRAK